MRASIRWALPLVAWIVARRWAPRSSPRASGQAAPTPSADASKPTKPTKPTKKSGAKSSASAPEKEAQAFLATVTSLLGPVAVSANLADWASLTDVTPEHTGQRTGADKALAALAGSKLIIEKTKALLKNRKLLEEATARQLEKLLLAAAEAPGTMPEVVAKRVEAEAHQANILDGYTFCAVRRWKRRHLRAPDHRQPDRRHPPQVTRSARAAARLDGLEGDRPPAQARPHRAASSCATRWRARWATARTSRSRSPTTG